MEEIDEKELLLQLAKQVKKLREQKGVSQQEAFTDTKIHFGRIEQGRRNISFSTLHKLCRYFEIPMKEFLAEGFDDRTRK